ASGHSPARFVARLGASGSVHWPTEVDLAHFKVNTFRNIYGSKLRRGIQAISYAKASRGFS
ncbi:hypothetical protein PRIPAC_98074, partial [Pristionchus pacificus]|uniref:Uncharacterized protein n=1 Tax=Pristionchus pacificus TaxID=54126 RepID=A0A2A6BC42_PRIPA